MHQTFVCITALYLLLGYHGPQLGHELVMCLKYFVVYQLHILTVCMPVKSIVVSFITAYCCWAFAPNFVYMVGDDLFIAE